MASSVDGLLSAGSVVPQLPSDVLFTIFSILGSHERRVTLPLVCKSWRHVLLPRPGREELWREVEICDLPGRRSAATPIASKTYNSQAIRKWLRGRRDSMTDLRVHLIAAERNAAGPVPAWAQSFGGALPALAASSILSSLTLQGPGVNAMDPNATATAAAGAVVYTAFSLPSLGALHIYDIPWAGALRAGPSCRLLNNLRVLVINRSFYRWQNCFGVAVDWESGGDAAEAWEALGRELASNCPNLERLDLAYTHAMSYCDPARGAVAAPWPPLRQLRELSFAHDLSMQPPPPPPMPTSASDTGVDPGGEDVGAAADGTRSTTQPPAAFAAAGGTAGGTGASADGGDSDNILPSASLLEAAGEASLGGAATLWAHGEEAAGGNEQAAEGVAGVQQDEEEVMGEEVEVGAGALFGAPMLVVDAALAAVELLTWLPGCSSLTCLDLRRCGLQAVPLAVTHLPQLARLDLQGNPLSSLRLPGPLPRLTWLRFSLDPAYDLVYDVLAAEVGEPVAAEEAWVVELPAPLLEELQVDSSSDRALELLREAASRMPHLRRLELVCTDTVG